MNADRKTAIAVGVLYILATAAPISTALFLGFLGGGIIGEPIPDYLVRVSATENRVYVGMLIEMVWALAVISIPTALFPILKRRNEAVALGFFSLRFVEGISTVVGSIILLTLLTVSQEFVKAGAPDASHFQAQLDLYDWVWSLLLPVCSSSELCTVSVKAHSSMAIGLGSRRSHTVARNLLIAVLRRQSGCPVCSHSLAGNGVCGLAHTERVQSICGGFPDCLDSYEGSPASGGDPSPHPEVS
jgi:hypothetical protein